MSFRVICQSDLWLWRMNFTGSVFFVYQIIWGGHQGMGRGRYAPAVLSLHRYAAAPPVHESRATTPSATHTLTPLWESLSAIPDQTWNPVPQANT